MEIKKSITIVTIVYLLFVIFISIVYRVNYNKLNKKYTKALIELEYYHNIDTLAIQKVDSIEYNIKVLDSVIYNIKTKYIDEIEVVKANNDIDAFNQFKELVCSD